MKSISGTALRWFLALELLCVCGFLIFLGVGNTRLALVLLLGPVQVLAWLVSFKSSSHVLAFFVALLPATGIALLPTSYCRYVYIPVTILLLVMGTRMVPADGGRGDAERRSLDKRDLVPLLLLGAALVLATISAVVHGWTRAELWQQAALLVEFMVLVYFAAVVPVTMDEVRAIIITYCVALSVTVAAAWLFSVSGVGSGAFGGIKSKGALNVLGAFLSGGAALLLGVLLQGGRTSGRVVMLLCLVVLASTLVLTRSRGAWLGFGAAVLYALLRVRSGWLWTVVVLALLLLLGVGQLREILVSRAGETSEGDPSFLGRVVLWAYAWTIFKANWLLGVGFDNFRYVKHFYGYPGPISREIPFHAHNIFLEMLVDLGVVGFIGFCWLYVRTLFRLDRLVRARDPARWSLALGLVAALLSYGAHGLFDNVSFHYGALTLLGVLLGLGIRVSSPSPRNAMVEYTP